MSGIIPPGPKVARTHPTPADRTGDAMLALAVSYGLAMVAFRPMDSLVARSFDDAFYFSRIAANLAHGLGSTFDGLHRTNGYQPLWMWLLVPVFSIRGASLEALYRAQLALQVVLLACSGLLLRRLLRTFVGGWSACLGMVLFVFLVFHPSLNGMETAVQVLLLLLLPLVAWRGRVFGDGGPGAAFAFGMVMGLTMLARLDMVFLVALLGVAAAGRWILAGGSRGAIAARVAALGAGLALVLVPYLAWNRWGFGAVVPISGMLKSSFPRISMVATPQSRLGVRGMVHLGLAVSFLTAWLAVLLRRPADPARRFWHAALALGAAAVVLHLTYSTLFMDWAVFRWHFLWYGLLTSLVAPEMLRLAGTPLVRRTALEPAWVAVPLVAALVFAGVREVREKDFGRLPYNWHTAAYEASTWTQANVPRDAVMAMDDAGLFGYFSGRTVVPLDGVVNDLAYQHTLNGRRLSQYLDGVGVRYLVKHDFGHLQPGAQLDIHAYDRAPYQVLSRLYHTWSDTLWVDHAREIYRSGEHTYEGRRMVVAIWAWSPRPVVAAAGMAHVVTERLGR